MRVIIKLTVLAYGVSASLLTFGQTEPLNSSKQVGKLWEQSVPTADKSGMIEGNAVLVFDGDTIGVVAKDGTRLTIRLRGIDAPESRQPFGIESAKQLAYMVQGMNVVVIIGEKESGGRYNGAVFLDGEDVSLAQIKKGMAWSHLKSGTRLSREQKDVFLRSEQKARTEKTGLWAAVDPIAPWVFRLGETGSHEAELKAGTTAGSTQTQVVKTATDQPSKPAATSVTKTAADRKYILGPRGGCYYLTEQGAKVYVRNKELCTKP